MSEDNITQMPKLSQEQIGIAAKVDRALEEVQRALDAPVNGRPKVSTKPPSVTEAVDLLHQRTRLRVEAMLAMAFTVWLTEMRGNPPFYGPRDMHVLNELKKILFSVNQHNQDFNLNNAE